MSAPLNIEIPTLILDKARSIGNIERMAGKAQKSGVRFRPHFKTHQSAQIGEWFRDSEVESITVSSVDMAFYFAGNGWKDITIAFPLNLLEMRKIDKLVREIKLGLLVESVETVRLLGESHAVNANLWINIDAGYKRTGIPWKDSDKVVRIAEQIEKTDTLSFSGIMTHSGHSYRARSKEEIEEIYLDTVSKMGEVRERLRLKGFPKVEISVGDTPSCSVVDDFSDVDEIRPGNFVFYDITQLSLGSCAEEEIAVAVACPVVAKHKERNEIVIYGGAVHLSKDFILREDGTKVFGCISLVRKKGWGPLIKNAYLSSLSQEHGIVRTEDKTFNKVRVGDILMVLPVHSCLTANLMKRYITLDGEIVESLGMN